jgi:hypothetical protein
MAVKEPKEITVVKGPSATGKTFAFRVRKDREDKDENAIRGSGKIEVGEKPVLIKLDTPEAKQAGLAKSIRSMVQKGYLTDVNAPPRKKLADKGE